MASILSNYASLKPQEIAEHTEEATNWYRQNLRTLKVNPKSLRKEGSPVVKPILGSMVIFNYSAKGFDTLPYWDRYPVVIPIEPRQNGFLGLNLHYLPPRYRAVLLTQFADFTSEINEGDSNTRLQLTYDMVKSISRIKWARPCIKQYITSYIRGQIREIPFEHWPVVSMLPTQKFVGNDGRPYGANTVYSKSIRQVR